MMTFRETQLKDFPNNTAKTEKSQEKRKRERERERRVCVCAFVWIIQPNRKMFPLYQTFFQKCLKLLTTMLNCKLLQNCNFLKNANNKNRSPFKNWTMKMLHSNSFKYCLIFSNCFILKWNIIKIMLASLKCHNCRLTQLIEK